MRENDMSDNREYTDEFGNVWRLTPDGPAFVRTRSGIVEPT